MVSVWVPLFFRSFIFCVVGDTFGSGVAAEMHGVSALYCIETAFGGFGVFVPC